MSFAHLHVHTEYSLLDGFSNIKKLVNRAKDLGMDSLAITDHGTMFGVIEFYERAREAGINPIIGVEAYLAARTMKDRDSQEDKKSSHLLLLAENQAGYQNLLKIVSAAQTDGFYYFPRIDRDFLAKHAEGLICSSGCLSAEVPRLLEQGQVDKARQTLDWYYEVFGKDNFFLELQEHNLPDLQRVNRQLLELGPRYNARFIATNDVHYINREDSRLQDVLLAVQTGKLLSDPDRMSYEPESFYLRSPQEMATIFSEVPESLTNTLLIAQRCHVDLSVKDYRLPKFNVPEGYTPETYMRFLCEAGTKRRFGERAGSSEVRTRLEYELGVIHKMGFDAYFLIVWDLCRYAREKNIWYNARGSAAGSLIAYTLDITAVDPIQHDLLFERFLNPGRVSMPDIDLDFPDDRRADVLEYTVNKYGSDKVAQIVTFGTMGARAALRDVARVMDISIPEVDRIAKLMPSNPAKAIPIKEIIEHNFKEVPDLKAVYNGDSRMRNLIDTAAGMEGVVRNAGTHAAGVVISDRPLIEYLPLHRPTSNAEDTPIKTVTQFEMGVLEKLKMLKVDFLGLATLTIMARACDLIRQRHSKEYNLNNIPTDDPQTYQFISQGNTLGVFQLEGSGMTKWVVQMKPTSLDNVIAMVALFRPGPMDFIPDYIARMHGEAPVEYRHPAMEPIFKDTYGIPIYQEQIMRAAVDLAGYSPSESDDLRKAISKKKKDEIEKHHAKFVEGAVIKGMQRDTAEAIFTDWEKFASYGFNKSHAADYGVLAVQTAFLKLHFPVEYMTALLSVTKHETDKMALYVNDSRQMKVPVLAPDVNAGEWDFTIEDSDPVTGTGQAPKPAIRFGLGAIKNVGAGAVEVLVKARQEGGPFADLNNFAARADLRAVGKRALESLIKVGALEKFGSRAAMLEILDHIVAVSSSHFRAAEAGQLSLFGGNTGVTESIHLPVVPDADRRETLGWERELIGMYMGEHPLTPYLDEIRRVVTHFATTLGEAAHEAPTRVAGMVSTIRPHQTKTGKMMAWVTLEDMTGIIELVLFPRTWDKFQFALEVGGVIVAEGKVDATSSPSKVLVDSLRTQIKLTDPAQMTLQSQPGMTAKGACSPTEDTGGAPVKRVSEPPATNEKASPPAAGTDAGDDFEGPPPPEDPPDWDAYEPAKARFAAPDLVLHEADLPEEERSSVVSRQSSVLSHQTSSIHDQPSMVDEPPVGEVLAIQAKSASLDRPASILASRTDDERLPQMVTTLLRSTGDADRDIRRIQRLHGMFISFPGKDHFQFQIFEDSKGHLIDFPNDTTHACAELLNKIRDFVGEENVRTEPIAIQ